MINNGEFSYTMSFLLEKKEKSQCCSTSIICKKAFAVLMIWKPVAYNVSCGVKVLKICLPRNNFQQ
jgi:hypothetical protein